MKVCFFSWIHWVESCYHSRRRWCGSQPGGGRSAPLFLSVPTKFFKGDFFVAKQDGLWTLLKYLKLYGNFNSDGNVRHFFWGSMDWNLNRDCWHGSWWHVVEFLSQMSIFRAGHQAVHIRSSLGQVGHAEGWMESRKARLILPKSESSICLRYVLFGTIYDIGGWVITFGSITLALLWYDINSPSCWCSPKHGGVFFFSCFVPRCLLDAGARWPFIFDPSLRIHGKAGLIDDPLVGWVWYIPSGVGLNCHVTVTVCQPCFSWYYEHPFTLGSYPKHIESHQITLIRIRIIQNESQCSQDLTSHLRDRQDFSLPDTPYSTDRGHFHFCEAARTGDLSTVPLTAFIYLCQPLWPDIDISASFREGLCQDLWWSTYNPRLCPLLSLGRTCDSIDGPTSQKNQLG